MRAMDKRLGKLEGRFGLMETEERRRARELVETLRRRIAARRVREGLPPSEPDEAEQEDLSGLPRSEILRRGRFGSQNARAELATDNVG